MKLISVFLSVFFCTSFLIAVEKHNNDGMGAPFVFSDYNKTISYRDTITIDTISIERKLFPDSLFNGDNNLVDILLSNRDFQIKDSDIYYKGNKLEKILINGHHIKFSSPLEILNIFPPHIISNISTESHRNLQEKFYDKPIPPTNALNLYLKNDVLGLFTNADFLTNLHKYSNEVQIGVFYKALNNLIKVHNNNLNGNWTNKEFNKGNYSQNILMEMESGYERIDSEVDFKFAFNKNEGQRSESVIDSIFSSDINNEAGTKSFNLEEINKNSSFQFQGAYTTVYKNVLFSLHPQLTIQNFESNSKTIYRTSASSFMNSNEMFSIDMPVNISYKIDSTLIVNVNYNPAFQNTENNFIEENAEGDGIISATNKSYRLALTKQVKKSLIIETFIGNSILKQKNNSTTTHQVQNKNFNRTIINGGINLSKYSTKYNTNITLYKFFSKEAHHDLNNANERMKSSSFNFNFTSSIQHTEKISQSVSISKVENPPPSQYKNNNIIKLSEYEYIVGNPQLRNSNNLSFALNNKIVISESINSDIQLSHYRQTNQARRNTFLILRDTTIMGLDLAEGDRLYLFDSPANLPSKRNAIVGSMYKNDMFINNLHCNYNISYSSFDHYIVLNTEKNKSVVTSINHSLGFNYSSNIVVGNITFIRSKMHEKVNNNDIVVNTNSVFSDLKFYTFPFAALSIQTSYDVSRHNTQKFENFIVNLNLKRRIIHSNKGSIQLSLEIHDLLNSNKNFSAINKTESAVNHVTRANSGRVGVFKLTFEGNYFK